MRHCVVGMWIGIEKGGWSTTGSGRVDGWRGVFSEARTPES